MNTSTKPNLVMAIALMTLVNGIVNIIWGIGMVGGTFGLSLICFPLPLFPIVLGGFEIAYAIKLLESPPRPVKPSQAIAILETVAVLVGNVFSLVVGILVLIFYNDAVVKDYFARLNGTHFPAAVPAPEPPPPPDPAPPAESTTEAPKRRPRKVA